jgi:aminoglycoside phosphotransferase (APT) family kinase protein
MPLADCWDELSEEAQVQTTQQLRSIMKQLRTVTEAWLPNHGTKDVFLDRRNGVVAGPFRTQAEFLDALSTRIVAIGSIYNPGPTRKAICFIEAMAHMPTESRMVFTHGNLSPENIWVNETGEVTAIIDWSQAGYAPAFWEYVKACLGDDDSGIHLDGLYDDILEPWPLHLAVMMHVHDIIW